MSIVRDKTGLVKRLVVIAACLSVAAAIATPRIVQWQHIRKGQDALQTDRIELALSEFRVAEAWNDSNPEIHLCLARAHRRAGEYDAAFARLKQAKQRGLDAKLFERERILIFARAGRVADMEPFLPELLQDASEDAHDICEAFATGYCVAMNFRAAEPLLDAWQSDYPDSALPLIFRGKIAAAREDWSSAITAFDAAVKLDPSRYEAWLGLGRVLQKDGRSEAAEASLKRATALKPSDPQAWFVLAQALAAQEKSSEADAALQEVLKLDPANDEAVIERAVLAMTNGENEEAIDLLEGVVEIWPSDIRANYLLGRALQSMGHTEDAESYLSRAAAGRKEMSRLHELAEKVTANPNDAELRFQVGSLMLRLESRQEGSSWLKSVLQYDPDHARAHELLAEYRSARSRRSRPNSDHPFRSR